MIFNDNTFILLLDNMLQYYTNEARKQYSIMNVFEKKKLKYSNAWFVAKSNYDLEAHRVTLITIIKKSFTSQRHFEYWFNVYLLKDSKKGGC